MKATFSATDWEGNSRWTLVKDRRGCLWNACEALDLLDGYLKEGLTLPQLAKRHGRGVIGIAVKLNALVGHNIKRDLVMQVQLVRSPKEQLELFH